MPPRSFASTFTHPLRIVLGVLVVHALVILTWSAPHWRDARHDAQASAAQALPSSQDAVIQGSLRVATPPAPAVATAAATNPARASPRPPTHSPPVRAATPPTPPTQTSPTPTPTPTISVAPALPTAGELSLPSSQATYLTNPKPPYPAISRRLGEQGLVVLRVRVDIHGHSERIEVLTSSGHARLDDSARTTVATWRFTPGRRQGVPEAMWFNIPIQFVLE